MECIGTIPAQTIDITNDDEIQEFLESCEENTQGSMKTKGEMGIDDLPPIAELTITVPESECVELGNISGIVDTLGKSIEKSAGNIFRSSNISQFRNHTFPKEFE